MRLEHVQRNDIKRPLMCGFQVHRTRLARIDRQQPGSSTDAPRITGFQSGEIESRCGRDEVVAHVPGEFEEVVVEDAAHRVGTVVVVVGVATAVPIPTGQRVLGAGLKFGTEHVHTGVHGTRNGCYLFNACP